MINKIDYYLVEKKNKISIDKEEKEWKVFQRRNKSTRSNCEFLHRKCLIWRAGRKKEWKYEIQRESSYGADTEYPRM